MHVPGKLLKQAFDFKSVLQSSIKITGICHCQMALAIF